MMIQRHQIRSMKVSAGKRGMVTGFTGAVELGISKKQTTQSQEELIFYVRGRFAPYCGTGHKTTFGLGQTRLGWLAEQI